MIFILLFIDCDRKVKFREMADEDQKTEHINLKVAGQDGSVVQFKIKKVISKLENIRVFQLLTYFSEV